MSAQASYPHVLFIQGHGSPKELERALGGAGFRGEGVADPQQFLLKLKQRVPRFCIVDLSYDDAPVLLSMMKRLQGVFGAKLPILALVPGTGKDLAPAARAAGAVAALGLPLDADDFVSAIAAHVPPSRRSAIELPVAVKWHFSRVAPALAGLATALDEPPDFEGQVRFYESRFRPFGESFTKMIGAKRKAEAPVDLMQSVRMYGVRNARNLLVAFKLAEVSGLPLIQWSSRGQLTAAPASVLKYATLSVDHVGEGSRYEQVAFASGLVMDLLDALAESTGGRKAIVRRQILDRYEAAMIVAKRSIAAAKTAERLRLDRQIIPTVMMREAGKLAMAICLEDYSDLRRRFERSEMSPALQHLEEQRVYGVSHEIMAALTCQAAPGLEDATEAVLFSNAPFMLRDQSESSSQDAYDLLRVLANVASV